MTTPAETSPRPRLRLTPMRPRDPHEPHEAHRAASSLELFFDLVFVVAISVASVQLHHALSAGHVLHGIVSFAIVFFAIWWAWMNFAWFATSFDTDDWLYRVLTIVQMGGVLVLAAGIPAVFEHEDFTVMIAGYVVMRLAMVTQWLRASRSAGRLRRATLTFAVGIAVVQALWLATMLLPTEVRPVFIVVLVAAELAVPVVAERTGATPWHPHHITERYGLFTLIVLGESLLASANAIFEALHDSEDVAPLIGLGVLASSRRRRCGGSTSGPRITTRSARCASRSGTATGTISSSPRRPLSRRASRSRSTCWAAKARSRRRGRRSRTRSRSRCS